MFYSRLGKIAPFTFGHLLRKSQKIKEFIDRGKNQKSAEKLEKTIAEHPELTDLLMPKLQSKKRFDFVEFMLRANLAEMDASMQEVLDTMEAALEKTAYVAGDTYTLAGVVATAFLAYAAGETLPASVGGGSSDAGRRGRRVVRGACELLVSRSGVSSQRAKM